MSFKSTCLSVAVLALSAFTYTQTASAAPLLCEEVDKNHMFVDTSQVASCLGAGKGNINGNIKTDDFLTGEGAGLGLTGIDGGSFTRDGSSGTFSLDASLWQTWSEIAIGFKFGTGNKADSWFVYLLNPLVSSGDWDLVNLGKGGGLSHVQLYVGARNTSVPEPGTLALLAMGLVGAVVSRRRKQA